MSEISSLTAKKALSNQVGSFRFFSQANLATKRVGESQERVLAQYIKLPFNTLNFERVRALFFNPIGQQAATLIFSSCLDFHFRSESEISLGKFRYLQFNLHFHLKRDQIETFELVGLDQIKREYPLASKPDIGSHLLSVKPSLITQAQLKTIKAKVQKGEIDPL